MAERTGSRTRTSPPCPPRRKNTSAAVLKTFNASTWNARRGAARVQDDDVPAARRAAVAVPAVARHEPAAQRAVRDRCERQPARRRLRTNASRQSGARASTISIRERQPAHPCTARGTTDIDGCPAHLPATANGGRSTSAYDVAAWADLWFYSNPIYVEVKGSSPVAGVEVNSRLSPRAGAARQRAAPSHFCNRRRRCLHFRRDCRDARRERASTFNRRAGCASRCCISSLLGAVLFGDRPRAREPRRRSADDRRRCRGRRAGARGVHRRARPRAQRARSSTRCGRCGSTTRCCIAKVSRCGSTGATRIFATA